MTLTSHIRSAVASAALLLSLTGIAVPAHAIITCSKMDFSAGPAANQPGDAQQVARLLAGMMPAGDDAANAMFSQYASVANDAWQAYTQNLGQPLRAWATKEVAQQEVGHAVFYPFSGPDLPSVLAVYPGASHFVMISDQYAVRYFDPFALKMPEQGRVLRELGDSWARFGRLGFFITQELNKGGERKYNLSPSMILMAFAVRLGYEIRAIRPICLDPADLSIRPIDSKDARWTSVRLDLRKGNRDIVVDYIQQDLSNRGLGKHPESRALIESLTKGPVLLKAASHLPQQSAFSVLRNAILTNSPIVVQDETGLEYDQMAKYFNVRLYGEYVAAHRHFREATNPSLIRAYKERAREVRPLDFRLGYEKEAGSAIQVATRR